MDSMFMWSSFNQPITFDTSSVANMHGMFKCRTNTGESGRIAFNHTLSLDTSSVTDMRLMFNGHVRFNQPLSFSDTSRVTMMHGMFVDAALFNQPLSFDTGRVTSMNAMFYGLNRPTAFNNGGEALSFDTSSVIGMSAMFDLADVFNQRLELDTSALIETVEV